MKFYNREKDIARLNEIKEGSAINAQFTMVTGRRCIGKTQLVLRANTDTPTLYFFVARKAEAFLCRDFQQEIAAKLNVPVLGEISRFGKLLILHLSSVPRMRLPELSSSDLPIVCHTLHNKKTVCRHRHCNRCITN